MSNKDFRHVCFKDLKNYLRKDANFWIELTEEEKTYIRTGLNVPTVQDVKANETIQDTYDKIFYLADAGGLILHNKYIITDFQSIYKTNNDEVLGYLGSEHESQTYQIILTPTSSHTFDSRVALQQNGKSLNWEVRYDITKEDLNGIPTKGKITYLKDEFNNSAYFDFKNYKILKHFQAAELDNLSYDTDLWVYTFNKFDGINCHEASQQKENNIFNNQFEQDCWGNVFFQSTNNNHFYGGCKNNVFLQGCEHTKFEWNTVNNRFLEKVSYASGSIQNAVFKNPSLDNLLTKEFRMIQSMNASQPVFVVTYIDEDTLTTQVVKLDKYE